LAPAVHAGQRFAAAAEGVADRRAFAAAAEGLVVNLAAERLRRLFAAVVRVAATARWRAAAALG